MLLSVRIYDLYEVKRPVEGDYQSSSSRELINRSGLGPGNGEDQIMERHGHDGKGNNARHQTGKRCPDIMQPFFSGHMYADGSLGRLECQRIDVSRLLDDDCPNGCADENEDTPDEGGYDGYDRHKGCPVWDKGR